jgi:hypothetical protein
VLRGGPSFIRSPLGNGLYRAGPALIRPIRSGRVWLYLPASYFLVQDKNGDRDVTAALRLLAFFNSRLSGDLRGLAADLRRTCGRFADYLKNSYAAPATTSTMGKANYSERQRTEAFL